MKAFKLLTICFVVCSLFVGNVFSQCPAPGSPCAPGIGIDIQGTIVGGPRDGLDAALAVVGDDIQYDVSIIVSAGQCPVQEITGTLTLPNLVEVPLVPVACLLPIDPPNDQINVATYEITQADIEAQNNGAPANAVRALAAVSGTARRPTINEAVNADTEFTTFIGSPCVEVTKDARCDISMPGYEVTYDITIHNCGDVDLKLNSVVDSLSADLSAAAIAAGCEFLAPDGEEGDECTFSYDMLVNEGDPTPLKNEITVVYDFQISAATGQVDANDVAEVVLIDPNFTVTKECLTPDVMVGEDAEFKITIVNTGDIALEFVTNETGIVDPFRLEPGDDLIQKVKRLATECPSVDNTIVVDANLPDDLCFQIYPPIQKSATDSCGVIDPEFTVEKVCLSDPITDANAVFEITITNTTTCGDIELDFEYTDPAAGINDPVEVGPYGPGQSYVATVYVPAECVNNEVSNTVYVEAFYEGESVGTDEATAVCPCVGGEGCTPGFWKNSPNCWACYDKNTALNVVFDFSEAPSSITGLGSKTMMEALKFGGGDTKKDKLKILLRHAVAAVLNACSGDVEYPDDVAGVVAAVNDILANYNTKTKADILSLKMQFEDWNELGCPISAQNSAYPCQRHDDEVDGF